MSPLRRSDQLVDPSPSDLAVRHEPFGVADLVGRRLTEDELLQQWVLVATCVLKQARGLCSLYRQPRRAASCFPPAWLLSSVTSIVIVRIERDLHQDIVEFVVIEPEHIQGRGETPDPRQNVFEDIVGRRRVRT